MPKKIEDLLRETLTVNAVDSGALIEIGARILVNHLRPANRAEALALRYAFFAGAQHLFASIMTALDAGAEPTARDLARMEAIDDELAEWRRQAEMFLAPSKGTA